MKLKDEKEFLNGCYKKIEELVGLENTKRLFEEYNGQQVTFPLELYTKEYIYKQIREEFDGANYKQLARKYSYSERTVRRILKDNMNVSVH